MAPTKKRKSYYTSGADDCLEEGETRLGGDDGPARKKKKKKKEPPPKKKKLSVKPAMSKKDKRKLAKRKFAALSPQAAAESQRVAKAVSEAKAAATIWPSKGKTKEGHTWSSTKEGGRVRVFDKPPEGWVGSNNRALREHPDYRNSNAGIYSAARFVKTRENTLAPGAPLDKTWESKGTVRVDGHRRPVDYSGFVRGVRRPSESESRPLVLTLLRPSRRQRQRANAAKIIEYGLRRSKIRRARRCTTCDTSTACIVRTVRRGRRIPTTNFGSLIHTAALRATRRESLRAARRGRAILWLTLMCAISEARGPARGTTGTATAAGLWKVIPTTTNRIRPFILGSANSNSAPAARRKIFVSFVADNLPLEE